MFWLILLCVLAFFCPPLAVILASGCVTDFIINVILTFLGILPGQIHAYWVIFTTL